MATISNEPTAMSYDPSARFDAGKSSIDGGIFGGGAWADSARAVKPRNPYSRGTDFLGRLEQAEHRDTMQQQQMPYYAQQQQMQMQQQRQMIRSAPSQQQHAYSRFPPQQQQQQQPPKGILKRQPPPPAHAQQQAAGGYRRLANEHIGIVDYTSSRVLKPPGGGSSFTLSDGSSDARFPTGYASQQRSSPATQPPPPPQQQPQHYGYLPDGRAAFGMSSRPREKWEDAHWESGFTTQVRPRRDPNASSVGGGIFGGGAYADQAMW